VFIDSIVRGFEDVSVEYCNAYYRKMFYYLRRALNCELVDD
jgi:hypothetical protein